VKEEKERRGSEQRKGHGIANGKTYIKTILQAQGIAVTATRMERSIKKV